MDSYDHSLLPSSGQSPRPNFPRAIMACERCRRRKTRCDQKFPSCTSCLRAKVECIGLDAATGREVPRSYVSHLEDRVAALELCLQKHGVSYDEVSPSALANAATPPGRTPGSPCARQVRSTTVGNGNHQSPTIVPKESGASSYASTTNGGSFARLMYSSLRSTSSSTPIEEPPSTSTIPAQLPPLAVAKDLFEVYFNHSYPQMPILERAFLDSLPGIYQSQNEVGLYFCFMCFAIASGIKFDKRIPEPEAYHAAALRCMSTVFSQPSKLVSLKAILLLGVYSTFRPCNPGVWYVLGMAVRLVVDMGLQSNTATEEECRLFWCTYMLDRQICVYLSRPLAIADHLITCPLPKVAPVSAHLLLLRRYQSEILRLLHQNDVLPRRYESLQGWREEMYQKLLTWDEICPKTEEQMQCRYDSLFLSLNYQQAILLLCGFNRALDPEFERMLAAATTIVDIYLKLWQSSRINYVWLAVHNLFIAGSSYVGGICNSSARSRSEVETLVATVIFLFNQMKAQCEAAQDVIESFSQLADDVRAKLYSGNKEQQKSEATKESTLDDAHLLALMNDVFSKPGWEQFFAGDEFLFPA